MVPFLPPPKSEPMIFIFFPEMIIWVVLLSARLVMMQSAEPPASIILASFSCFCCSVPVIGPDGVQAARAKEERIIRAVFLIIYTHDNINPDRNDSIFFIKTELFGRIGSNE